jgi:hypothetical protein
MFSSFECNGAGDFQHFGLIEMAVKRLQNKKRIIHGG